MRLYFVLIAFLAIAINSPTQAWDLRVPNISSQSSWQSEHNKKVEKDYEEIKKWQQDVGIVAKPRGPGLMEYFWPFVLGGALIGIFLVFQMVPAKFRKQAIGGTVAIVVGAIGFRIYSMEKQKADYQAEKAAEQASRNAAIEAYKSVFKTNTEPIKQLFNGDDPRFLAGEESVEQLKKLPGIKDDHIYNPKYTQLLCTASSPCIGMIFPENHPIAVGLWNVHFYYCKTKANKEILTGFGFNYNEVWNLEQYNAAVAGLVDAGIIDKPFVTVNKERKMAYINSPGTNANVEILGRGKGLSIIWSKVGDKKGVDLCGNSSFDPR